MQPATYSTVCQKYVLKSSFLSCIVLFYSLIILKLIVSGLYMNPARGPIKGRFCKSMLVGVR